MKDEGVGEKLSLQHELGPNKRGEEKKSKNESYTLGLGDPGWVIVKSHSSRLLVASSPSCCPHLLGAHEKFYIPDPENHLVLPWDLEIGRSCPLPQPGLLHPTSCITGAGRLKGEGEVIGRAPSEEAAD